MGKWGDRLEAGGGKDGVEVAELGGNGVGVFVLNFGFGLVLGLENRKGELGLGELGLFIGLVINRVRMV